MNIDTQIYVHSTLFDFIYLFMFFMSLCFPACLLSVSSWHKKEAQASMAATLFIYFKDL